MSVNCGRSPAASEHSQPAQSPRRDTASEDRRQACMLALLVYNPATGFQKAVRLILLVMLFRFCRPEPRRACCERPPGSTRSRSAARRSVSIEKALAQGPPSIALLNNTGNHYLVVRRARRRPSRIFERIVKSNPQHANANLQLARMAADRHQGRRALEYLSRVADSQPDVRMLRAEALTGRESRPKRWPMLDGLAKDLRAPIRAWCSSLD